MRKHLRPWMEVVREIMRNNPDLTLKEALKLAKRRYRRR